MGGIANSVIDPPRESRFVEVPDKPDHRFSRCHSRVTPGGFGRCRIKQAKCPTLSRARNMTVQTAVAGQVMRTRRTSVEQPGPVALLTERRLTFLRAFRAVAVLVDPLVGRRLHRLCARHRRTATARAGESLLVSTLYGNSRPRKRERETELTIKRTTGERERKKEEKEREGEKERARTKAREEGREPEQKSAWGRHRCPPM